MEMVAKYYKPQAVTWWHSGMGRGRNLMPLSPPPPPFDSLVRKESRRGHTCIWGFWERGGGGKLGQFPTCTSIRAFASPIYFQIYQKGIILFIRTILLLLFLLTSLLCSAFCIFFFIVLQCFIFVYFKVFFPA